MLTSRSLVATITALLAGLLSLGNLRGADMAALTASTIVVYNKAVPDSISLARFYAQQRGIARDHLLGLTCSTEEEISRDDYDTTIAEPLRKIFEDRHWWTVHENAEGKRTVADSTIHFVALMKGMPLKIRPTTEPYPGDEPGPGPIMTHNEASVDSELSTLAFQFRHISGAIPNPYFQSFRGIGEFESATLLLVCRLDAPATATVRHMITDAIAAEKNGLWGRAYVDASHNAAPGADMGDKWMAAIVKQLHKTGIPVVYDDSPGLFPVGFPLNDCSLYYGWYAGQVTGPFTQPEFHFVPGAVAVHIHSFSASTLRDPNANWVGPLLSRGAAATMGNVYEPYLQLTSYLDIFNDRLLHGFTFAESAYMSVHAVSWMSVMVGDPLYRPFGSWLQLDAAREPARSSNDWKMYHDFAIKNGSRAAPQYQTLARQVASRARNGPMIEDLGAMAADEGNFAAATTYFQQARASYTKKDDILRVVLQEADALIKLNKQKKALDLVRSVLRIVSDSPSAPLLRRLEQQASGSPPPPKPP
jgi:uncharacterized protein (TIGR03790 family)